MSTKKSVRVGVNGEVTFERRLEGVEELSPVDLGEEPWGRRGPLVQWLERQPS